MNEDEIQALSKVLTKIAINTIPKDFVEDAVSEVLSHLWQKVTEGSIKDPFSYSRACGKHMLIHAAERLRSSAEIGEDLPAMQLSPFELMEIKEELNQWKLTIQNIEAKIDNVLNLL